MPVVVQIVSGAEGYRTPLDGEYLVEYDPSRDGLDRWGRPMSAHIRTSSNLRDARVFDELIDAYLYVGQIDPRQPIREDGKENRPLTYFTLSLVSLYDV